MAIPNISEISHRAPAPPVPVAAPAAPVKPIKVPGTGAGPVPQPVHTASIPPPPPPPAMGDMDVRLGVHEATGTRTYNFVDPDSGQSVNQIPAEKVLNLVALIIRQLEAEGRR